MTPLNLNMILDFYSLAEVDVDKSEAHRDSAEWLLENKMLCIDGETESYKTTEKLEFFVKEILKTKLPEVTYIIPK